MRDGDEFLAREASTDVGRAGRRRAARREPKRDEGASSVLKRG
jgi:hypothetical protein